MRVFSKCLCTSENKTYSIPHRRLDKEEPNGTSREVKLDSFVTAICQSIAFFKFIIRFSKDEAVIYLITRTLQQ